MSGRASLSRRSFVAQVLGGGMLLTAARAGAQTPAARPPTPVAPAPPPAPAPTRPVPPGVDNDTGANSDAQGSGRRRTTAGRFRPCRSDSDTGSRSDPRCKR